MVTYRTVYIYICFGTHTGIFLFCQLTGPRNKDIPRAMSTLNAQLLFLTSFSKKRNQGPLEKWPVLGLGERKLKMCQEHLVVP